MFNMFGRTGAPHFRGPHTCENKIFMTLVFRYMEESGPVERFVTFMPNRGHKAADMFKALADFLEKHNLSIQDCRGQSYNNASSMSGKYNCLQALVQ